MYVDLTLNPWNVAAVLFGAGILWQRVRGIEKKLDTFITREVVDAKLSGFETRLQIIEARG